MIRLPEHHKFIRIMPGFAHRGLASQPGPSIPISASPWFTACLLYTSILNSNLNGDNIVSVPLQTEEWMRVGYICSDKFPLSPISLSYISELKKLILEEGFTILPEAGR